MDQIRSIRKCDQVRRKLQIWSHLLKKLVMENFCAVNVENIDRKKVTIDPKFCF